MLSYSFPGSTAGWTDEKAKDGSQRRTFVLQDVSFTNNATSTCMRIHQITKAFTVMLTFSSVVYICIFSNTVLGFCEERGYFIKITICKKKVM